MKRINYVEECNDCKDGVTHLNCVNTSAPQEPILPPYARDEASPMLHLTITECSACNMPTEHILVFPNEVQFFQLCCIHYREFQEQGLFKTVEANPS